MIKNWSTYELDETYVYLINIIFKKFILRIIKKKR